MIFFCFCLGVGGFVGAGGLRRGFAVCDGFSVGFVVRGRGGGIGSFSFVVVGFR